MALEDEDIFDCFVHLPASAGLEFALDDESIAPSQDQDAKLAQLAARQPQRYVQQMLAPITKWFIVIYQGPELLGKSIFLTNCLKMLSDTIISCSVTFVLLDYSTQFPCISIIAHSKAP
jgi:hypothetical protein